MFLINILKVIISNDSFRKSKNATQALCNDKKFSIRYNHKIKILNY